MQNMNRKRQTMSRFYDTLSLILRVSLSGRHLNLLALDRVPRHGGSADNGQGRHGSRDVEGVGDGTVVRLKNNRQKLLGNKSLHLSSTDGNDACRVKTLDVGIGNVGDELVLEDVLSDADEESTA